MQNAIVRLLHTYLWLRWPHQDSFLQISLQEPPFLFKSTWTCRRLALEINVF